jgi:hypothetical protein
MIDLEPVALNVWDLVCKNIADILQECGLFGLIGVLSIPDPSVEKRIEALKKLNLICQVVIENVAPFNYSVMRVMYNAKQQILNLEILLSAAKNGNEQDFELAKNRLQAQCTH